MVDVTQRDRPWVIRTYSGHSSAQGVQRAVPQQPGQGPDRAVGRVRPADPDRLRRRPRARPRRGRQGRRPGAAPRRDAHAVRGHPPRGHEHVDDDQRDGDVAARALHRAGRGAGRRSRRPRRHDPERHREGVPLAGHVHLRARAEPPAHRRRHHPHGEAPAPLEPDQRLPVPPAGGGRDAGAGARVRARDRGRRARRGARLGSGERGGLPPGRRAHLVLHRRRASGSSRRCARCARSHGCGTASASSATASRTRSCDGSATACR